MLSERKLNQVIKHVAMQAQIAKQSFKYRDIIKDDLQAIEIAITNLPSNVPIEEAMKMCPTKGEDSFKQLTLKSLKRLYK